MQGWISLHRCLLKKPIWKNSTPEQKAILVTLLLLANHQEEEWEWKGKKFKAEPGQFITSLDSIKRATGKGISTQNIRTALKRFEKLGFLTNEPTKTGRLITIVNWRYYQDGKSEPNKATNKEVTKTQQRGNKDLTPNNNDNNDNNDNKEIYIAVFNHWNSKDIIEHRKLTDKMKRTIKSVLKDYTKSEIINAINNYERVLSGPEFYWTHKWTLKEFLDRGLEKFLDWDVCVKNYSKEKGDKPNAKSRGDPNDKFKNDKYAEFFV